MNIQELVLLALKNDYLIFNAEKFIDAHYFELVKLLEHQKINREVLDFEFGFGITKYSLENLESIQFFFNKQELEDFLCEACNIEKEEKKVEPFLISDDLFADFEDLEDEKYFSELGKGERK